MIFQQPIYKWVVIHVLDEEEDQFHQIIKREVKGMSHDDIKQLEKREFDSTIEVIGQDNLIINYSEQIRHWSRRTWTASERGAEELGACNIQIHRITKVEEKKKRDLVHIWTFERIENSIGEVPWRPFINKESTKNLYSIF